MTVITIDTELAEALMEIKNIIPQIKPKDLKKAVFSYYKQIDGVEILDNLPSDVEESLSDLVDVAYSPEVEKIIEKKIKTQTT